MSNSQASQQSIYADMDLPKSHTMLAASMTALGEGAYGPTWKHTLRCKGPTIVSQLLLALYLLAQCAIFTYGFSFHELTGWTMVLFAWIHTITHWCNFAQLATKNRQGPKGFLLLSFATGPGLSGHLMLAALMLIAVTSRGGTVFKRFWFFHYSFYALFILWSIHGTFCMIKANNAPACVVPGPFWKYWICPGALYISELILREWRGNRKSSILTVLQHPGNVLEIQMQKENTVVEAGQV